MDRVRASDGERERIVAVLRDAHLHGRLTVDELDERSAAAYAAATRGELDALIDDLPQPPPMPRPHAPVPSSPPRYRSPAPPPWVKPWPALRPWLGGMQMFEQRWRTSPDPVEAGRLVMDHVVPLFYDEDYVIVSRSDNQLVLQNQPGDTVTIDMTAHHSHTETHVWGVAPRSARQGLDDISR